MAEPHNLRATYFRRVAGWGLACYWMAIFSLTHVPMPPKTLPLGSDKLAHSGMYFGLTFLLGVWISTTQRVTVRTLSVIWAVIAVYGVGDELLQIPVGRTADLHDWMADCAGGLLGIILFVLSRSCWKRFRFATDRPSPIDR